MPMPRQMLTLPRLQFLAFDATELMPLSPPAEGLNSFSFMSH